MTETDDESTPSKAQNLSPRKLAIAGVVLAFVATLVAVISFSSPNSDKEYLSKLVSAEVANIYESEAMAIKAAKDFCWFLKAGGLKEGQKAEEIAVEVYCPEHLSQFRLLRPFFVSGKITIQSDPPDVTVQKYGQFCEGYVLTHWFSRYTELTVRSFLNEIIAETTLRRGNWNPNLKGCSFPFTFKVMEGEVSYKLKFSHLQELEVTEAKLKEGPLDLIWGGGD
jgi:hypothetical protein